MTTKLMTETDTPRVEKLVLRAAKLKFGAGFKVSPVFEHGQWWALVENTRLDIDEAYSTWSVVDAEPGQGTTGLDFEQV